MGKITRVDPALNLEASSQEELERTHVCGGADDTVVVNQRHELNHPHAQQRQRQARTELQSQQFEL